MRILPEKLVSKEERHIADRMRLNTPSEDRRARSSRAQRREASQNGKTPEDRPHQKRRRIEDLAADEYAERGASRRPNETPRLAELEHLLPHHFIPPPPVSYHKCLKSVRQKLAREGNSGARSAR